MPEVRYTEDVKDTVALAARLARKQNQAHASDRLYLQGLLLTHRRFNRLDSLLKELNVPPSRLRKELTDPKNGAPTPPTSDVLKNAELIAAEHTRGGAQAETVTVDVEHMLKALTLSADPVVLEVMRSNQITPERVEQSLLAVRAKQGRNNFMFFVRELMEVVVFVLVFLILIKSFLGELRLIPSESMVPGLQIDDRLVIERVSRWTRPYQRGDILVFYPPMTQLKNDPWSLFLRATGFSGLMYKKEDNIDVAYIKRLIGRPGDTVEVKPGVGVYVNGKKLNEPYVNDIANTCTFVRPDPVCGPVKVPEGSYYMMGDNRNLSLDSRYWGFAREDRVIGRAVFRIWPPERIGTIPSADYAETK